MSTLGPANWETNLWVVVTPGHTYGPFLSQQQAAGTPVAKWTTATVRLATEADMAAIYAQDEELDNLEGQP
jgi:hypothetical protein